MSEKLVVYIICYINGGRDNFQYPLSYLSFDLPTYTIIASTHASQMLMMQSDRHAYMDRFGQNL